MTSALRLFVAAIVLASALFAVPAAASAAPAARTASPSSAPAVSPSTETTQLTIASSGKVLTVPSNYRDLSPAQLAPYGLVPNIPAPAGWDLATANTEAGVGASSTLPVRANSAYKWVDDVYIGITGAGWMVDEWYSSTNVRWGYNCTFGMFFAENKIVWTTQTICGTDTYYWAYIKDLWTSRNMWLCNEWAGVKGRACIYVWQ